MKRELIFKVLFGTAIGLLVAFCLRIDPIREYGWWGGIWQGCIAIYHWILSLFDNRILVRAVHRTLCYDIWWWATLSANIIAWMLLLLRLIIPFKKDK